MRDYIDQRLDVDNSRSRTLLDWSPNPRRLVEKRFPFMIERLRSEAMEWHARNEAALRRDADRPTLRLYHSLIAIENMAVEAMERFLQSEEGGALPHYRQMGQADFRWLLRLLYRLLLTSIQMSNRMLILNYLEVTCGDRFRAGFSPDEIRTLLAQLHGTILTLCQDRPELKGLDRLLYEQISVPFEFGLEEVRDQHERFLTGAGASADGERSVRDGDQTPRELIEKMIWSCLVQRK